MVGSPGTRGAGPRLLGRVRVRLRRRRAGYEASDGFTSVGLPAIDDEQCRELVVEFSQEAPGLAGREPDPRAVDALIAADAEVTEAHVTAVIGPTGWDPAAGAAAAREFRRV